MPPNNDQRDNEMSHDNVLILAAQLPIFIALLYIAFIDWGNDRKPFITGWRRTAGWIVYYVLFLAWLAAMLGAFTAYFSVPAGVAPGYLAAAVLMQASLQRSREVPGGAAL